MIKSLEMFLSTDREDIEYNEVFIDTEANSKIVDIDLLVSLLSLLWTVTYSVA